MGFRGTGLEELVGLSSQSQDLAFYVPLRLQSWPPVKDSRLRPNAWGVRAPLGLVGVDLATRWCSVDLCFQC